MPNQIKVKHLYIALSEIQGWTKNVMAVLGSLDPEMVVPADRDRCSAFSIPIPMPVPPLVEPDNCFPLPVGPPRVQGGRQCVPPFPGGPWPDRPGPTDEPIG